MSSFGTPLAMNPVDNPLIKSLFEQGRDQDANTTPPGVANYVIEETGDFTITEGGDFIIEE